MSKKYIAAVLAFLILSIVSVVIITIASDNGENVADTDALVDVKFSDDAYCVLVMGRDRASGLCDVMMLVSFDTQSEQIFVLQLPRDTYANYGSDKYRKLNGAQKYLGNKGICTFFEESLGVKIDGYFSLDLDGFSRIIDLLGGVEIELEEPLRYSDSSQGLYISLESGRQTLSGEQAEMFVRYRSGYTRGDLDRLDAQKKFLSALFGTLRSRVNASNAYELVASALKYSDTDLNIALCAILGLEALNVKKENLFFCTLPGEDVVSAVSGGSFYVMSKSSSKEVLREYFNADIGECADNVFLNSSNEDFKKIYQNRAKITIFGADSDKFEN